MKKSDGITYKEWLKVTQYTEGPYSEELKPYYDADLTPKQTRDANTYMLRCWCGMSEAIKVIQGGFSYDDETTRK